MGKRLRGEASEGSQTKAIASAAEASRAPKASKQADSVCVCVLCVCARLQSELCSERANIRVGRERDENPPK